MSEQKTNPDYAYGIGFLLSQFACKHAKSVDALRGTFGRSGPQVYDNRFRAIENSRASCRFSRGVSALYTPAASPLSSLSEVRKKAPQSSATPF